MSATVPTLFEAICNEKRLTAIEILEEYQKLVDYSALENKRCFAGNNVLYHYFIEHLCDVENEKEGLSIRKACENKELRDYWENETLKMKRSGTFPIRFFECIRRGRVSANMFKPTTAKHIYTQFNANHVLDPTMGWGGRLLGAMSLNISYTGIDTNINLRKPYNDMIKALLNAGAVVYIYREDGIIDSYDIPSRRQNITLIWGSCLDDMGIDYVFDHQETFYKPIDLVLTSPPYGNKEVYPHMTRFQGDSKYYNDFLYPLIDKCRVFFDHANIGINISPKMFKDFLGLCPDAKKNLSKPFHTIDLLQQKNRGIDKKDLIYFWASHKKVADGAVFVPPTLEALPSTQEALPSTQEATPPTQEAPKPSVKVIINKSTGKHTVVLNEKAFDLDVSVDVVWK